MLVAFYNITWDQGKMEGKNSHKHEQALANDLHEALREHKADAVMLSECGAIGEGLEDYNWTAYLENICGPGYAIKHQSHYTSILRLESVEVLSEPKLMGPMTTCYLHEKRTCQHVRVKVRGSSEKPIDIFNVHSPASKEYPLDSTVRSHVLRWLYDHAGPCTIIGGDLNTSLYSLDGEWKDSRIAYHYTADHKRGDIICTLGLKAVSVKCDIEQATSAHRLCLVMVDEEATDKSNAGKLVHQGSDAGGAMDAASIPRSGVSVLAHRMCLLTVEEKATDKSNAGKLAQSSDSC